MKYVDSHNHQVGWSVDASVTLPGLISEANALGLDGITLTDHYDYNGNEANPWCLDAGAYAAEMAGKRRTDDTDLLVLSGIELGYTREHEDHLRTVSAMDGFDHVVLSLHYFNGLDPYYDPVGVTNGYTTHRAFVHALISEIAHSARQIPEANTIGHYDFVSRYLPWDKSKFNYRDAPEAFDALFAVMIRQDQSLEINAGTVSRLLDKGYSMDEALPDRELLARYKGMGGRLVTLASDAHKPGRLGLFSDLIIERLTEAGLMPCYFVNKQIRGA